MAANKLDLAAVLEGIIQTWQDKTTAYWNILIYSQNIEVYANLKTAEIISATPKISELSLISR